MQDPSTLQQIKRLHLRTRRQVADVLAGAYLSVFKGSGVEFDEVRPYVPGDEIRSIDWNVTARTGVPHVKRFVEERELTVMLVVDISGSQDAGSTHQSKREATAEFAALLAFSAIANKDKVGLLLFHEDTELFIPPRKGQRHALRVLRELYSPERSSPLPEELPWYRRWLQFRRRNVDSRRTDIGGALEFCRRVLPRKSVLFVLSDFIDAGYLPTLRNVNRKHDVVSVFVSDALEQQLPAVGLVELRDAESGAVQMIDASDPELQQQLLAAHENRVTHLRTSMRSSGIDLIELDTVTPVIEPLVRFLRMRERRIHR